MTLDEIAVLNRTFSDKPLTDILAWAMERFGRGLTFATSFSVEDIVLIDGIAKLPRQPSIFFLDTGRLHEETYAIVDRIRARYHLLIQVYAPDTLEIEAMSSKHGFHHIYEDKSARINCCAIRKLAPLKRALAGHSAWITGQRREQAASRQTLEIIEWDATNALIKINPLALWSIDQVWRYAHQNQLPYNPLHDQGYPSIGCAPCTRAIRPGEDLRAGRWWWEDPQHRECGLHRAKETHP